MADFKEKTQTFILGILVGLVVAGSFFIFKLDAYIEKLKLYKNITKTFYLDKSIKTATSEENEAVQEAQNKTNESRKEKKKFKTEESQKTASEPDSSAMLNSGAFNDSVEATEFTNDENAIIIEKDEMISSLVLSIMNLTAPNNSTTDSLLQKISKIRDDDNFTKRNISVEIWRSPLNYRGYKMTKNKLVLYGFPQEEKIKLFKLDDVIYLKSASNLYRLEQTYEFKPYQYVEDMAIANKLK